MAGNARVIITFHPGYFVGIVKPEPLKYFSPDSWSRRLAEEHSAVYPVGGERIYFLQVRYHAQLA